MRLDRKDGISKVCGTLLCVTGASVITLYKGPTIYSPSPRLQTAVGVVVGDAKAKNWTLGCIFLIGHCLSWAGWLVLQAPVLKKFPARLTFTSYQLLFGVIQFLVIAAFAERNAQAWLIHSGAELFTVFYAVRDDPIHFLLFHFLHGLRGNIKMSFWMNQGVVASGIAFAVQIWCIDRGGPVFVAVYQPVQTLVVAIMSSVVLGEEFYLGG